MSNIEINKDWIIDRFNLQYNNIFSNKAPGIEDFEISMYMSIAHVEVLDEYAADIDLFEKNRSILSSYIKEDVINQILKPDDLTMKGINYQLFEFTSAYWRVVMEYIKTKYNTEGIMIKPIRYDEFNLASRNPHKKPNGLKGWRLDINYDPTVDSYRDVKIFFKKAKPDDYITQYVAIYLITPEKIDVTIENGIPDSLKNNLFLVEKIINRAVELATRDYKENSLQSQMITNNRSK